MLTDDELHRLRDALLLARYTVDGVPDALSTAGFRALGRGETLPGRRATEGGGPLATLVRLFLLGTAEPPRSVAAALGDLGVDRAVAGGLLTADGDRLRAALDVRPYGPDGAGWFVVSDLPSGPGRPAARDHVLGVGAASVTLVQATVPREVARALDVGTGSGVQALHLGRQAGQVTATDSNPRALALARATAVLSGVEPWELLPGDRFAPVEGRSFDTIVCNPPFVVAPRARFTYRDGGLPGDEMSRRVVVEAAAHLADGGVAVLLANWLHVVGDDWRDRVRDWLAGTGCDAWALQREVEEPAAYAEVWLRDGGEHGTPAYDDLYGAWLDWFAEHDVEGVGFGIVVLRRVAGAAPVQRVDEVRHEVEQPLGPVFGAWLDRVGLLRDDAALLAARLAVAPSVELATRSVPGDGGWAVTGRTVVQRHGLRLRGGVDDVGVALLAACDGRLPVGALLELLGAGFGVDTSSALRVVAGLVSDGFLVPAP